MPKLLWLCEYPTVNGGEQSLLSTVPALRAAGFELHAVAPAAGPLAAKLAAAGVRLVPLDDFVPRGASTRQARFRAWLANVLARERPHLLAANSLAMARLSGPVAAELGLASLGHLRDIVRLSRQAVDDINCHTRLLSVSEAVRDFHAAQGIARQKLHVLPNGVDLHEFSPRPRSFWLHAELGLPPRCHLVGNVGQLIVRKGQDVLARAAAALAAAFPDLHYVLVGQRHSEKEEARRYEVQLRRAFATGELAGRAHFLGLRTDVSRILPELALYVHAARQEPLGRVLLEAAACGVAIVATDVGGTSEIFPAQAAAAELVPPDDVGALAAAISVLVRDPDRRERLGLAARCRVQEAFDVASRAADLVRHYRQTASLVPRASGDRESSHDVVQR